MVRAHDNRAAVSLMVPDRPWWSVLYPGTPPPHAERRGLEPHGQGGSLWTPRPSPGPFPGRRLHPGGLGLLGTSLRRWPLAGGPGDTGEGPPISQQSLRPGAPEPSACPARGRARRWFASLGEPWGPQDEGSDPRDLLLLPPRAVPLGGPGRGGGDTSVECKRCGRPRNSAIQKNDVLMQ